MSDVTVSVVENTTSVVVSNDVVEINVTESLVTISTAVSGPQGASGIGYTGVTSTSNITIGAGLKTFTLVSGYQGAFITGMRVRAIHSDTPTYFMEGTANYIGAGTLIITVDKFNGSGSHNLWAFASAGEVGQTGATGATGSSGVIAVTAPITNSGSSTSANIGIDQSGLTLAQSQVTSLITDLAGKANLAGGNTFTGTQVINAVIDTNQYLNMTNAGNAGIAVGGFYRIRMTGGASQMESSGAANVVAVIKGAASQSANLLEIQNSASTVLAQVTSGGSIATGANLTAGTLTALGRLTVVNGAAGTIGAVIQGASGQTADILQLRNNANQVKAYFKDNGDASFAAVGFGNIAPFSPLGGAIVGVSTAEPGVRGIAVRGVASQTANLQEWQNSAGTILARTNNNGFILATQLRTLNSQFQANEENGGGATIMVRQTATAVSPGANFAKLYFRDGTTAGTLKLVTRSGASGLEETLFDNLDTSGTSSIAIGSGVRATDAIVATAANGVGYMGLPQNSTTTGSYTIVAADAGKHVYASATRTITIPANSALALPIGTTLTFIAGAGATMTIAITADTMYLAGAGTTGSRTLAAHGIATAVKTTSTTWLISGNGLT
jgi:hypothetical protein